MVCMSIALLSGSPYLPACLPPMPPIELFGKAFAAIVKHADIGHVRLHDLRHACASFMLKAGVHAKVLYSHILPGLQEAAAEQLDAALQNAMKRKLS
jgi:integrase